MRDAESGTYVGLAEIGVVHGPFGYGGVQPELEVRVGVGVPGFDVGVADPVNIVRQILKSARSTLPLLSKSDGIPVPVRPLSLRHCSKSVSVTAPSQFASPWIHAACTGRVNSNNAQAAAIVSPRMVLISQV